MGPRPAAQNNPQDALASYFDDSAVSVRQAFSRYVRPTVDRIKALSEAYPISFVFLSTFATLSLFPVLAFIVISTTTVAIASTIALCFAFAFSTVVFLLLGGILVTTLGFALLLSGIFTVFAISAYLTGRLVLILHRLGRPGFRVWSQEVAQILSFWVWTGYLV